MRCPHIKQSGAFASAKQQDLRRLQEAQDSVHHQRSRRRASIVAGLILSLIAPYERVSAEVLRQTVFDSPQSTLPREYIQTVWTVENGLPQNSVTAIQQTRDGYLWLGTFGGLAKFDGVKFTIFNSGNTPGMLTNRIISLYEDRAGTLWIGTSRGLVRYDAGQLRTFTTAHGLGSDFVLTIAEDRAGNVKVFAGEAAGHVLYRQVELLDGELRRAVQKDERSARLDKLFQILDAFLSDAADILIRHRAGRIAIQDLIGRLVGEYDRSW